LIVTALVACRIASLAMLGVQPAHEVAGIDPQTDEIDLAGDEARR
jgi:hypothetical protein